MDTKFTNSQNSKTPDLQKPLLNLPDKTDLKMNNKYVILSNRSMWYT